MELVIVPNDLESRIYAAIDKELGGREIDIGERADIYSRLLAEYHEHGFIPQFSLKAKEVPNG